MAACAVSLLILEGPFGFSFNLLAAPGWRVAGLGMLGLGLWGQLELYQSRRNQTGGTPNPRQLIHLVMMVMTWAGIILVLVGEASQARNALGRDPWELFLPVLRLLAYGVIYGGALGLLSDEVSPEAEGKPKVGEAQESGEEQAVRISRSFWCILLGLVILALQLRNLGWSVALSLIPGAIVIQHALFLSLNKRRTLNPNNLGVERVLKRWHSGFDVPPNKDAGDSPAAKDPTPPVAEEAGLPGREGKTLGNIGALKKVSGDFAYHQYFGPGVLVLRYGVPALLLTATCLTWTGVFFMGWFCGWPSCFGPQSNPMERAALVGLGGAFSYTIINLGQRAAQADLTSWSSYTCLATLVAGPILAIIAGTLAAGPYTSSPPEDFKFFALCFIAGYSPQPMTRFIFEYVRRQLAGGDVPARLINNLELVYIRGITMEVADRLREEGIEDVFALAYAEPYHLFRNTGYSHQRILTWIDEALLYQFLSTELAQKLIRECGITGAVDLGWHYLRYRSEYPEPFEELKELGQPSQATPGQWLDGVLKWNDKRQVADLLNRIYHDPQVEMVAALYKLGEGIEKTASRNPPAPD